MAMMQKMAGAIIGVLALSALAAAPASAQTAKGLIDPTESAESELAQLPHMTPAIARSMVEKRPFKTIIELNKFLLRRVPLELNGRVGKGALCAPCPPLATDRVGTARAVKLA